MPWLEQNVTAEWLQSFNSSTAVSAAVIGETACVGHVGERWIVQLSDEARQQLASPNAVPSLLEQENLPVTAIAGLGTAGQIVVTSHRVPSADVAAALRSSTLVSWFERDSEVKGQDRFAEQTAFQNPNPVTELDSVRRVVDAPRAWNRLAQDGDSVPGDRNVIVAVIDSGIQLGHEDLIGNLWANPLEIMGNNRDDDGNGQRDDRLGYDFVDNDANPLDENGHGTNVAGIIGARGDNDIGIKGLNWQTSILPVRFLDADNRGTISNAIAAVNYVRLTAQVLENSGRAERIRVINASWGFYGDASQGLRDAIQGAGDQGILFVAAAGNGNSLGRGVDLDQERIPFYPASFNLPNVISVGAAAEDGRLASFSNFGAESIDIVAPGSSVLTTEIYGASSQAADRYKTHSGTSFAAPFVSGVAALLLASPQGRNATVAELREAIQASGVQGDDLAQQVSSGANLNAFYALQSNVFAPRASATLVTLPATNPPVLRRPSDKLTIRVDFTSLVNVDVDSIGTGDLIVRRPKFRGHEETPLLISKPLADGPQLRATYEFQATNLEQNGLYQVILRGGQVRDSNNVAAAEQVLATFEVRFFDPESRLIKVAATSDRFLNGAALRSAVDLANSRPGKQTILIEDGFYRLSSTPGVLRDNPDLVEEDVNAWGDLDITDDVTLLASGHDFTTIAGAGDNPDDPVKHRVLHILGSQVELNGVSMTVGRADIGGAIFVESGSEFALSRSFINENVSGGPNIQDAFGGGLANYGTTKILETTFDANSAVSALSEHGGGAIYNAGVLIVENSTFTANRTFAGLLGSGGGGAIDNGLTGTLRVANSTFSENSAVNGQGGAIYSIGQNSRINHATFFGNGAAREGGGVYSVNQLLIIENTIIVGSTFADEEESPNFDLGGNFKSFGDNLFGAVRQGQPGLNLSAARADQRAELAQPVFVDWLRDEGGLLRPLADNGGLTRTHALRDEVTVVNYANATDQGHATTLIRDQVGNPRNPTLTSDPPDLGAFERYQAVIEGVVYDDFNGNGRQDSSEPGRAGVMVFLDNRPTNGVLDDGESFIVTPSDDPLTPNVVETGHYSFLVPPLPNPAAYNVRLVTPRGFAPTRNVLVTGVQLRKVVDTSTDLTIAGVLDNISAIGPASVNADEHLAFIARHTLPAGGQELALYTGRPGAFIRQAISEYSLFSSIALNSLPAIALVNANGVHGVYQLRPEDTRPEFQFITIADRDSVPDNAPRLGNVLFRDARFPSGVTLFRTERTVPGQLAGIYFGTGKDTIRKLVHSTTDRYENVAAEGLHYGYVSVADDGQGGIFFGELGEALNAMPIANNSILVPDENGNTQTGGPRFDLTTYRGRLAVAQGSLAFYARDTSGKQAVYFRDPAGLLRKIAGEGTPIQGGGTISGVGSVSREVSVRPNRVVFVARDNLGRQGVYVDSTDDALPPLRIMDTRDLVDTQRPVSFEVGSNALASQNTVAFSVTLADGRQVVMLATLDLASSYAVSVDSGDESRNNSFGLLARRGTLAGTVFVDQDADGRRDVGETGRPNATIYLDQNNNGLRDSGEQFVRSSASGDYRFDDVPAFATYTIRYEVAADLIQTFPAANEVRSWSITLQPGDFVSDLDFGSAVNDGAGGVGNDGVLRGKVTLRDAAGVQVARRVLVYLDANQNKEFDEQSERSVLTDLSGNYVFRGLSPGSYDVRIPVLPDASQVGPQRNIFRPTQPLATSLPPTAITIEDFKTRGGTGSRDMVIATKDSVIIRLNNNLGAFGAPIEISLPNATPSSLATGDFNNDGYRDIAVGSAAGNSVIIVLNQRATRNVPFAANSPVLRLANFGGALYTNTRGIVQADVNNDRRPDLLTANDLLSGSVSLYVNRPSDPNRFIDPPRTFNGGRNAFAIRPVHLNDDNGGGINNDPATTLDLIDFAVANFVDGTVTLLRNAGGTTLVPVGQPLAVGIGPASIASRDFNGDGWNDLAVANYNSDNVTILLGRGNFLFRAAYHIPVPAGATNIVAADFDLDGDFDLVVSSGKSGTTGGFSIVRNRQKTDVNQPPQAPLLGQALFGAAEFQGVGFLGNIESYLVAVGDIDRDSANTPDLLIANGFGNKVTLHVNRTQGITGGHSVVITDDVMAYNNLNFSLVVRAPTASATTLQAEQNQLSASLTETDAFFSAVGEAPNNFAQAILADLTSETATRKAKLAFTTLNAAAKEL